MPNLRRKNSQCEMVLHSPMPHIPPEILTHIFRLYLPSLDEQMMPGSPVSPPSSAQRPSCLAQVCRLWRAIVESDPHLWTSIHFCFPSHTRIDERKMQAIFDLHFERSGTLPLSLTFIDHRCFHSRNKGLISLLADQLRGHSRRWKRISLHLTCNYLSLLFAFTTCDLSSLEHLHISGNGGHICDSPRLYLGSAINLKSFASSGFYSHMVNIVGLHWGRLAEVSFDFVPRFQCLYQQFTHLDNCQNVITCSLGIDRIYSLPSLPQTITLPRLQTLRIRRLSDKADAHIVDFLILPQLETLEIDSRFLVIFDKSYIPWQDRIFSNLLVRSGCVLRHLLIQDVDFPNEELVRCLTLSPTLASLCFIPYPRSQDTGDVIRKLVVSPAMTVVGNQTQIQKRKQTNGRTAPLVPELRNLTLATDREGSLESIMEVLRTRGDARTRAAGVAALQRVEVIFFRKPRSPRLHRPRAKLKKVERFRSKLAQWASEVEIENANDEIGGEVVAKVNIWSTATAMEGMAQ